MADDIGFHNPLPWPDAMEREALGDYSIRRHHHSSISYAIDLALVAPIVHDALKEMRDADQRAD